MSTAEVKSHLHQLVVETNDTSILNKVREYFAGLVKTTQADWWDTISEKEKKLIETGIAQLQKGQGIPHTEVRKKVDSFLKKK